MPTITLSFKPKQITKNLLAELPDRARDVITGRYGLGVNGEKLTLEAIGQKYGVTRERVRQIENYALGSIRKSNAFKKEQDVFEEIQTVLDSFGAIVSEETFLNHISKDKKTQNHLHSLLVLGDDFHYAKEDREFHHRWHIDHDVAEQVHRALQALYSSLKDDQLLSEKETIDAFLKHLQEVNRKYHTEEVVLRWLGLSKQIGKNPLGEWGKAHSSNVRAKGMRDYAYLAIKRHGSPMHFSEVAKAIETLFNKKAHVATCHNELIKDSRFVLVGRGLYALSEWGYTKGVVKDVIREILEKNKALSREAILDKVRNERYVKENTIMVNLQDSTIFKKNEDGTYTLR